MAEHLLAINHKLKSPDEALSLFGSQDAFLHLMEKDLALASSHAVKPFTFPGMMKHLRSLTDYWARSLL